MANDEEKEGEYTKAFKDAIGTTAAFVGSFALLGPLGVLPASFLLMKKRQKYAKKKSSDDD